MSLLAPRGGIQAYYQYCEDVSADESIFDLLSAEEAIADFRLDFLAPTPDDVTQQDGSNVSDAESNGSSSDIDSVESGVSVSNVSSVPSYHQSISNGLDDVSDDVIVKSNGTDSESGESGVSVHIPEDFSENIDLLEQYSAEVEPISDHSEDGDSDDVLFNMSVVPSDLKTETETLLITMECTLTYTGGYVLPQSFWQDVEYYKY